MKVIIAGRRDINDYSLVIKAVEHSSYKITEVVSGGATGVDTLGEQWAKANNVSIKQMKADWNRNGKAAGPIRNSQMADYADAAIVIWDGQSPGSKNMIENMLRKKKPVFIWMISDNCLFMRTISDKVPTSATLDEFL